MLTWFIYLLIYSFIGFLLETGFSFVVTGGFIAKKTMVIGFLCPVYGLGALAILGSTYAVRSSKIATFIIGAAAATAVEYLVGFFYETLFSMRIWNYSKMPLNLNGHVCLLFTFFWGILSLLLVYWVHPKIKTVTPHIPKAVTVPILILFLCDAVLSLFVLHRFGSKQALSLTWLLRNY